MTFRLRDLATIFAGSGGGTLNGIATDRALNKGSSSEERNRAALVSFVSDAGGPLAGMATQYLLNPRR